MDNKETKNKIIELLSFIYIAFFLLLLSNGAIKTIYSEVALQTYSSYIYITGGVGLLLYIVSKIISSKFNKYEIIVFIMIILAYLSLINAIDIPTAILGKSGRYEGLLVWLSYYIFILNAKNIKEKHYLNIVVCLISTYAISNIVFGLYQVKIGTPSFIKIVRYGTYASGFLGNSNFFGSLSSIFYGLALGMFIKEDLGIKKYLLGLLLLIANLGVIINGAMSAMVSVIVINLVCFIQTIVLIIKKEKKSRFYLVSLIIGTLSFALVFFIYSINRPTIKNDIVNLFSETKSAVVDNKVEDSYGSGRIYIWKKTLEKLKETPITGYGIDNFRNAFDSKLKFEKHNIIVDKAHNDYLQKAVCEGIISSVVFVIFLLMIFFKGMFKKLSPIYYGLLLAFTCYSIQAFFNISFINVAPIYFIIIGLIIGKLTEKESIA